jgi:hypothetical protein
MSGIGRFLAAIALTGAVGGVGVFARHIGSVPEPRAIHLTAPPRLHVAIQTTVAGRTFFRRHRASPGPGRAAAPAIVFAPVAADGPAPPAPPVEAPVFVPAAPPAAPSPPAPAPPAPAPPAPAPPTPQPPPRLLTTVPAPVVAAPGRHRGHAYGHAKHPVRGAHNGWARPDDAAGDSAPPQADVSAAEPAAPASPVPVSPNPPVSPDAPPAGHGNGHGGNGHGKGHGGGG